MEFPEAVIAYGGFGASSGEPEEELLGTLDGGRGIMYRVRSPGRPAAGLGRFCMTASRPPSPRYAAFSVLMAFPSWLLSVW